MRAEAEQAKAPPLLAWLASAALAVFAVCLLISVHRSQEREIASLLADYTRDALIQAPRGALRVIGLGSSLLKAATPARARSDDLAAVPLHWARITKGDFGLAHLSASLAAIEGAPPEVLVIEKNLLAEAPETDAMTGMREGAMYVFEKIRSKMNGEIDPLLTFGVAQNQDVPCVDRLQPMTEGQMARIERDLRNSYQKSPDPAFVAALQRLAQRGVHVMIVDIRRSAPIERATEQVKQRWFARLHQMLPAGSHLSYHTGPSYSQINLYCDARHLNAAGARQFRAWWWEELQQVQKAMR